MLAINILRLVMLQLLLAIPSILLVIFFPWVLLLLAPVILVAVYAAWKKQRAP